MRAVISFVPLCPQSYAHKLRLVLLWELQLQLEEQVRVLERDYSALQQVASEMYQHIEALEDDYTCLRRITTNAQQAFTRLEQFE